MARIPLTVGQQSLDVGSAVRYPGGSPVGEAMQRFGDTVGRVADHFRQVREREDAFDADIIKTELQGRLALAEDEALATAPANGDGLHDGVYGSLDPVSQQAVKPGKFDGLFDEFAAKVPESQRARFVALKEGFRLDGSQRLGRAQLSRRREYEGVEIEKAQTAFINSILQSDPNDKAAFDAYLKQGEDLIAKMNSDELERTKRVELWHQNAAKALGEAMIRSDPSAVRSLLGLSTGSVVDKIIGVESGGNASAKNPNSSATGLGQFIDSTWLATIRKHEPSLMQGRTQAQVLALRNDPTISRRMTGYLVEDNRSALAAAGAPTDDAALYLAHFAGSGGAIAILKADPNASVASILGGPAVRANPFLGGKTAADLIAWASGKMGGPARPPDTRFASLSPTDRLSLANRADVEFSQMQNAQQAMQKAEYQKYEADFDLRIATGQVKDPQLILGDSVLSAGDKAKFYRAWEAKNKEAIQVNADLAALGAGSLTLDAYSADDRKRMDNVYDDAAKRLPPADQAALAGAILQQTGIVPQPVINTMRRGLSSTVPGEVAAAMQMAQRVSSYDPAALGRREGGTEVQKAADDFSYMVNTLNLSPDAAAQRIIEGRDPAKQRERKVLEPAAKEFVKALTAEDLAGQFDDAWFGSDPSLGIDEGQRLGIQAEFLAIAEDQFFATNGDADLARNRAVQQMKALYGVSTLSGGKTVMKHPPERYWPASRTSGEGYLGINKLPFLYAQTQLRADVSTLDPNFQPDSIRLVTTPETDRDVKAGKLPGYAVVWRDKDGALQTLPGKLWRPDPTRTLEQEKARTDREQEGAEVRARAADKLFREDSSREDALDAFIAGPPTEANPNPVPDLVQRPAAPVDTTLEPTPGSAL